MNPQPSFCPNLAYPSRGKIADGNLRVHHSLDNRWRCRTCNKTFSGRKGTPFYGLKHDLDLVVKVLVLLAHGCPLPAIVAAFDLDERTIAKWQRRAGGLSIPLVTVTSCCSRAFSMQWSARLPYRKRSPKSSNRTFCFASACTPAMQL